MFRRAKLHLSAIDTSSVERAVSEAASGGGARPDRRAGRATVRLGSASADHLGGRSPPRLRSLCLSLPETTERPSHGEPTWFIRDKKTFVSYANRHHDDRVGFWCAAPGRSKR